jgi:hypothetical protein
MLLNSCGNASLLLFSPFGSNSEALWDTVYISMRSVILTDGTLEISCHNYQKCIYSVILTVETELCTRTTDKGRYGND